MLFSSLEIQQVCGFSCEDITSMFKELKGLGVVVKQLSNELNRVVSTESSWVCALSSFLPPSQVYLFPVKTSPLHSHLPLEWQALTDHNGCHMNTQICLAVIEFVFALVKSSYVFITMLIGNVFILEPWLCKSFHPIV